MRDGIRTAPFLATGLALLAVGWRYLPPDLQHAHVYVYEFFTKENGTVNTPLVHEMFGLAMGVPSDETRSRRLRAAPGWELTVFATDIPHPRMLRVTSRGDLIVSQPRQGRILLVLGDRDEDGRGDGVRVLIDELDLPHGIELFRDGSSDEWLYIAEPRTVIRALFDASKGALSGAAESVASLPDTSHHHMRTLRFGPDGWLYVPIGSNCNLCAAGRDREQAILRMRPDGGASEIYASGIRNVIGFDWQPGTGDLYAFDIGADYLGDDFPPEELNLITAGAFYGFPFAHGDRVPDPELGPGHEAEIAASRVPVHVLDAHSTPLGMVFLTGEGVPPGYRGAAIVALHGSWNRTRKNGHKLISLHWLPDGRVEQRDFVSGFEQDEDVIGRPVDVAMGPDGSIYVSDDYAGAIYRLRWDGGDSR